MATKLKKKQFDKLEKQDRKLDKKLGENPMKEKIHRDAVKAEKKKKKK